MKRKLKTIQKILQENPEAYFETDGCLINKKGNEWVINPMLFSLFGKDAEIDSRGKAKFGFLEEFFEPEPEKKKIYFHTLNDKNVLAKTYRVCDNDDYQYLGSITLDTE